MLGVKDESLGNVGLKKNRIF